MGDSNDKAGSDGVQMGVFFVFNTGANKRSWCVKLLIPNERTSNDMLRYDNTDVAGRRREYISLCAIHKMGDLGWKVVVGLGTNGCVFMSSIWVRTSERHARLD